MAYGGASGFSGAAIETLFDGLGGAYGKGSVDEKIANYLDNLGAKEEQKSRVMWALKNGGEGFESAVTDLSNQLMKSIYNGKNMRQNWGERDRQAITANVIANTILGFMVKEK